MSTTYYLLRTGGGAVGAGPYIGHGADGKAAMVPTLEHARRFESLEEVERAATELKPVFDNVEIEIRNSPE